LRIEPAARQVSLHGRCITLTSREFDLLHYFVLRHSQVLTRDQLLAGVWGTGFDGYAHTVNSHINRLRAKLEPDPARPRMLVTVWGSGYRLDLPDREETSL
jgi:DNA-binding response OmpR family regulator